MLACSSPAYSRVVLRGAVTIIHGYRAVLRPNGLQQEGAELLRVRYLLRGCAAAGLTPSSVSEKCGESIIFVSRTESA